MIYIRLVNTSKTIDFLKFPYLPMILYYYDKHTRKLK